MGFIGQVLPVVFVSSVAAIILQLILHNDYGKMAFNHEPGACRYVEPIENGSEDVELLSNGIAVITSGLRYIPSPEVANTVGKLFLFDFNGKGVKEYKADEIKLIWAENEIKVFNPHGIKSHTNAKGDVTLYVVNHTPTGDRIELFALDVDKKSAKHLKSIKHDLIYTANNLAVIGEEEFYVTNDHYFSIPFLVTLEYHTPYIRLGNIVHYKKGTAKIVDQFLPTPNGVTVDKQRKHLFVASPLSRSMWVYTINKDNSITKINTIVTDCAIDNLFLDEQSLTIWTAGHPILHELITHLSAPKSLKAPSQVIQFRFKDASYKQYTINDPYLNDGTVLRASSVATKFSNQLLIGTVHHKLLLCDMKK